jgi:hypothetical protein
MKLINNSGYLTQAFTYDVIKDGGLSGSSFRTPVKLPAAACIINASVKVISTFTSAGGGQIQLSIGGVQFTNKGTNFNGYAAGTVYPMIDTDIYNNFPTWYNSAMYVSLNISIADYQTGSGVILIAYTNAN